MIYQMILALSLIKYHYRNKDIKIFVRIHQNSLISPQCLQKYIFCLVHTANIVWVNFVVDLDKSQEFGTPVLIFPLLFWLRHLDLTSWNRVSGQKCKVPILLLHMPIHQRRMKIFCRYRLSYGNRLFPFNMIVLFVNQWLHKRCQSCLQVCI